MSDQYNERPTVLGIEAAVLNAEITSFMFRLDGSGLAAYINGVKNSAPIFSKASELLKEIGKYDREIGSYVGDQKTILAREVKELHYNMEWLAEKIEKIGREK